MGRIRAVTLDLWMTLILDTPERWERRARLRRERLSALLGAWGVRASPEEVGQAISSAYRVVESLQLRGRDMPFTEQVSLFLDLLSPGLAHRLPPDALDAVAVAYGYTTLESPPAPAPGVPGVLAELRRRGYRLGLISNTGTTPGSVLRALLRDYGVLPCLEVTAFSNEVGLAKPSPSLFRLALEQLGVSPGEAVHIGDQPWADVAGALGVGMRAVQVDGAGPSGHAQAPLCIASLEELPQALDRLEQGP